MRKTDRRMLGMAVAVLAVLVSIQLAAAEEAASDGAKLYGQKCAMCHGQDGVAKAMAKGSANFNDPAWQQATSVDAIVKVTTEGKGKMPKFDGKMTPDDIKLVATYVKQMK